MNKCSIGSVRPVCRPYDRLVHEIVLPLAFCPGERMMLAGPAPRLPGVVADWVRSDYRAMRSIGPRPPSPRLSTRARARSGRVERTAMPREVSLDGWRGLQAGVRAARDVRRFRQGARWSAR